jgi:hypothetical protein
MYVAAANVQPTGIARTRLMCFMQISFLPNATDETRAGERGVSPFEKRKILSGKGACDLGHIPRVVLWQSGSALFMRDSV